MSKEYAPDYYIRIITASGEINPTNVLSITTNKDIYSTTGSFRIVLDYNQHFFDSAFQNTVTFSQNSAFFRIKPMDYIEIYMAENAPQQGFGIYDRNGYYDRPFNTDPKTKKPIGTSKEDVVPLGIVERYNNPYLVFCGFIDAVENNFGLTENAANNQIIIRGQCLAKFLAVHYLFFNFPYDEMFLRKVTGQIALLGLRPNEAIDLILVNYLFGILTDKEMIAVDENDNIIEGTTVTSRKLKKAPPFKVKWVDIKKKFKDGTFQSYVEVIHNAEPSFNYFYWATDIESAREAGVSKSDLVGKNAQEKAYYPWGRMQYIATTNRNIANISSESPVFDILKQSAQLPFNEFFMDEVGNIVLRRALDAWNFDTKDSNIDTQAGKLIKDWVEIKEEDVLGWQFTVSDDELKTLVLSVPIASWAGKMPIMLGAVGMAPVTEEIVKTFMALSEKKFNERQKLLFNKAKNAKNLQPLAPTKNKLAKTLAWIRQTQKNHIDNKSLSSRSAILEFWQRYGVRPITINDLYSDDFVDFYMSAYSLFQKYANYWWKGNFIVRGDSKYKIGQKCIIKKFANDKLWQVRDFYCYINAVSHSFTWGEQWTTTITFTRGQIEGTEMADTTFVEKEQIYNYDTKQQENKDTEKGKEIKKSKKKPGGTSTSPGVGDQVGNFSVGDPQTKTPNATTQEPPYTGGGGQYGGGASGSW